MESNSIEFRDIVNLACKAILSAITNIDYVAESANDFKAPDDADKSLMDLLECDPIASI